MFAIDDAAANDVMVFRMVRRSGLLYRIVSSLAAVCFDCPLEVVWLATNTARLGFGTMVRNHDSLAATDAPTNPPGAAAPRKWASSHFESRFVLAHACRWHELITLPDGSVPDAISSSSSIRLRLPAFGISTPSSGECFRYLRGGRTHQRKNVRPTASVFRFSLRASGSVISVMSSYEMSTSFLEPNFDWRYLSSTRL